MIYHQPVLLVEAIEGLNIRQDKIYADVTFGGGGHSKEILKKIEKGRLIAFDQDDEAEINASAIHDDRFLFLKQNFKFFKNNLKYFDAIPLAGIIADLGVSSHQFDTPERGFSFRFNSELDMRMNQGKGISARDIINKYSKEKLKKIFIEYGELVNANRIADEIEKSRESGEINTVNEFLEAIKNCVDRKKESQYLAQVFQALRIEVNNEINILKDFLLQAVQVLEKGGRLVIISYHSLEDRLVKNFMRSGNFNGEVQKDFFGNIERPLEPIFNKVIVPSEEELIKNPRGRSAKLRIAEKK